jgi:hypothetical protein
MSVGSWLQSEMEYGRNLADSGWQGARAAWDSAKQTEEIEQVLSRSVRAAWAPTLIGAGVGAFCALLLQRRKSTGPVVALSLGVAGGLLGFAAGVAWETREISSEVARGALRQMSTTRDEHWLEKHPINFG